MGDDGTLLFSTSDSAETVASREAAALELARTHNKQAAERALEKRVNRLKCSGCGAILNDAAAFQEHCNTVEHDDDFTCAAPHATLRLDKLVHARVAV